ncbi:penicillin-binding protein 1C [Paraburkholderia sp. CNPSo 3076]|uniref:penicillin-binding protein 1C n=1 Tax=Paraburkholderia sp. CNPSo 3076 TaxID=2940936 RepID=UPI00225479A9|nr:penicillin-binding protein 1C [Paraburkholderia sp. CNPSo 3076]MCX5538219.1 penicillin-binding protein 1C [Paraburkholderia sp. CNPSo 3076]
MSGPLALRHRAAGALGVAALCLVLLPRPAFALPTFDDVRGQWKSSDWVLLARDGTPLQRTRVEHTARRGDWVALADVSPALREAIIVSEDKRFYEHSGVDWRGATAAAWANLWSTRTRGASTVTMQLTGLFDDDPKHSGQRSLAQKAVQAVDALRLERTWRKDQILEAYLNLVPFRGETVGLAALSQTLFGKAPSGLDERESAVAAALIRAPNAPYTKVATRACRILRDMRAANVDGGCPNLDAFVQMAFARPAIAADDLSFDGRSENSPQLAPHFARQIANAVHPAPGMRVRSTLDANLQRYARDTLTRTLIELNARAHPRNVQDGAVVVLDNATGEVLAWVGSSGGLSKAREVDAALALRQAGSTLKPFLYAEAIDERRVTTASLLDDAPLDLAAGGGLYMPQNYDKGFKGWVSVRTALGSSLNVPAVRTLVMVTPHRFAKTLSALGLPLTQAGDYYGFSLALGSADVSLVTLTNAYRALANGGVVSPIAELPASGQAASSSKSKRVFSRESAFIVTDVLADNNARTRTFDFDSPLDTRMFSAVKTGTSKDMRDNWTVGFTSRYTVGVWVGNADGSPMWDVSGVTGAAPVWAAIVGYLHRRVPSVAPAAPPGVERVRVQFANTVEPSRNEWFIAGTSTPLVGLASNAADLARGPAQIGSPVDGTIFALDPDIPAQRQRVWFERATGSNARVSWRLDGKALGGAVRVAWLPWPGKHTLELVDAKGRVTDTVRFEVRGALAKPQKSMRADAAQGGVAR